MELEVPTSGELALDRKVTNKHTEKNYTSKLFINYFPEVLALENQDWWKFQSNFHDNCDGTQVAIHIKSMQRLIQRKHECLKMSHFTIVASETLAII